MAIEVHSHLHIAAGILSLLYQAAEAPLLLHARTYSWVLNVQTSAIVVYEKLATQQKVLDAAEAKQLVQLKLQEPEHAYGLKGMYATFLNE